MKLTRKLFPLSLLVTVLRGPTETPLCPKAASAYHSLHECPSCGGLNLSCPHGCGRDPLTGELDGSTLRPSLVSPSRIPEDAKLEFDFMKGEWAYASRSALRPCYCAEKLTDLPCRPCRMRTLDANLRDFIPDWPWAWWVEQQGIGE